ncbi:MAG: hypothetical protein H6713_09025 [Myxococcales bacterium]|nr:hypothetical protein [Myxococcales bacterium]MCB9750130.1 hypothetical protein [Myxococcales bacterium]
MSARRNAWRRARRAIVGALALLASGCAGHLSYERLLDQPYSSAPLPERARVFLVAGGVDVANFAQEVISQRDYWRAQGVGRDEIVCYYAKPTRAGFAEDREQFVDLRRALRDCYPARARLIQEHLALASRRAPPFLYLYVTTHGRSTLIDDPAGARAQAALSDDEIELLDQYFLQLGADPGLGADAGAIVHAYRGGARPDELLLTPHSLQRALASFDPATPKVVVLQGCHSGGFVDGEPGARGLRHARVTGVENLTVITAARHDRTSFGCDPGAAMTYFGAVFNLLLAAHDGAQRPTTIPWRPLFDSLDREITRIESLKQVKASHPVYFSNAAAERDASVDADAATTASCLAGAPPCP